MHAVRTLLVATALSFLFTRFVLAPDWIRSIHAKGNPASTFDAELTRRVFWRLFGLDLDAALLPALAEYAVARLTFPPILAGVALCGLLSIAATWYQRRR